MIECAKDSGYYHRLERIMKEIRRRTRVVVAFPDGQPCLNLAPRDYGTSPVQRGRPNATRTYGHSISRTYLKPKPLLDLMCERFSTLPGASSIQPDEGRDQMDRGEEISSGFVVACRDSAEFLEVAEEVLNEMTA
jgi:hypothetical protein